MRLGTLRDGTRDGALVVVSREHTRLAHARAIAPTLQAALDRWDELAPRLAELQNALDNNAVAGEPVDFARFGPPLPRAYEWVDGSMPGVTRSMTACPWGASRSSRSISSNESTTIVPTPCSMANLSSASVLLLPCM